MRYGGVEDVKRRKVEVELSSAATNSSTASEKEANGVGVFDLDLLDCTICLEPLASPIYQCENGHVACVSCSHLMKSVCPSCKQPTGAIRCLALEKLIDSLKVKCKYADQGCTDMVKFSLRSNHEISCSYEPLTCPFAECNFHDRYELWKDHVARVHPDNCGPLLYNVNLEFSMQPTDRYRFLVGRDRYLVVNREKISVGDLCYLTYPKDLGANKTIHYQMEISIVDRINEKEDHPTKFTIEAPCLSDGSTTNRYYGSVVVPEDRSLGISVIVSRPSRFP